MRRRRRRRRRRGRRMCMRSEKERGKNIVIGMRVKYMRCFKREY